MTAQDDTKHGSATQSQNTLASDIAQLASLSGALQGSDEGDEGDVAELLRRLSDADGVAKGVEEKLDGIIGSLDQLLANLEDNSARVEPTQEATSSGKSQPR